MGSMPRENETYHPAPIPKGEGSATLCRAGQTCWTYERCRYSVSNSSSLEPLKPNRSQYTDRHSSGKLYLARCAPPGVGRR